MVRRYLLFGMVTLSLSMGTGCGLCKHSCADRSPSRPPSSGGGLLREPMSATDPYIAPQSVPPAGSPSDLPPPTVPESRFRVDPQNPKRELLLPENLPGAPSSNPATGSSSNKAQPDRSGLLGEPQEAAANREAKKISDSSDFSGLTTVKKGLVSGRVPTANGLDRLKQAGFRTVAYLHAPESDASTLKKDVDAKGMTFVDLPISAEKIAEGSRGFNELIANNANRPLFVCDENGTRTGSMWYLYFRTAEYASDDTARLLAAPLGLSDPPSAEQTTFWVAIRNYLSNR
ncbi:MAG: hypothetical protein U0798_04675 [Gemmataceae bacterium]